MKNPKLCQIIAVSKGLKVQSQQALTDAHHHRLKPQLVSGLYRYYQPFADQASKGDHGDRPGNDGASTAAAAAIDEAAKIPDEIQRVQATVPQVLGEVTPVFVQMLDAVLTQDSGNQLVTADVKVGDRVLLADAPVTYLLFLEKQLTDLTTFIEKLPTRDPGEEWHPDPEVGLGGYTTKAYDTLKMAKVYRNHVLAYATDKHAAQVQVYQADAPVGKWRNHKKTGALNPADRNAMLARVRVLKAAVVSAREEANTHEVEQKKAGAVLMNFVFNGT